LYSKDKSSLSNIKQHSITVGLTFPVLLVWGLSVANHHHHRQSTTKKKLLKKNIIQKKKKEEEKNVYYYIVGKYY